MNRQDRYSSSYNACVGTGPVTDIVIVLIAGCRLVRCREGVVRELKHIPVLTDVLILVFELCFQLVLQRHGGVRPRVPRKAVSQPVLQRCRLAVLGAEPGAATRVAPSVAPTP